MTKLAAFAALLSALVFSTPTALADEHEPELPACIASVQELEETDGFEEADGTYTCLDEYTTEAGSFRFGDSGYLENLRPGTSIATVASADSQVATLVAADPPGTTVVMTNPANGEGNARFTPRRAPSVAKRNRILRFIAARMAAYYTDYFEELVSYGVRRNGIYTEYGRVRLTHRTNLNGRQAQNTPTLNVVTGPSVAPGVRLSSGCGSQTWGPVSSRNTWNPGRKDTYCASDGTFRNTNAWNWSTLGNSWTHINVSSSWQCNRIYTAPCWFGNR